MDIKKIPKETQNLISASTYINNFTRAIEELVYNSLDAESTAIAIRVSIQESFIQILDNGIGIKKENFYLLGQKYATSKYIDANTLKSAPNKYGYCGLSLASVIEISQEVLISSRFHKSEETWLVTYHNGKKKGFCIAPARPSKGTTVEIRGFLYNLNIQRKIVNNVHELQNIKTSLEQLSLIHCNISISLRDDYKNEIIFKLVKKRDVYQTLLSLFEIKRDDVQELQVEKNEYKVKAFISKGNMIKSNQWIYLNGKFISKTEIHKKVNKIFNKVLFKNNKITKIKNNNHEYFKSDLPFYFIFISCPVCDFDITYNKKQIIVEFKDWTEIDKIIEKLIQFYSGESFLKGKIKETCELKDTRSEVKEIIDKILNNNAKETKISIQRGIKGKNIKRKKIREEGKKELEKSQKCKSDKGFNLKEKQIQKDIIKNKDKKDKKKEFKKPSFKDNHGIKCRKKASKKENNNSLINKFINPTDSVKKRWKKYSFEAKLLKFTRKSDYNKINKRKDKFIKEDGFIKVKTSQDLIKTFDEVSKSLKNLEKMEMQHDGNHSKITDNSQKYQNYSKQRKNFKHFTSFRQNCSVTNYFNIKNNVFNADNVNIEYYSGNENKNKRSEVNSDNFDNIRSDLSDKKSLITSDFDNNKCFVKNNVLNKTYSVHLPNNFGQFVDFSINNEQNITKFANSPESQNNTFIDPLSYCEIVLENNEMEDVVNSFTNGEENDLNYELLNEENSNLLENMNECEFENMVMKFPNNELNFCENDLKNNEMEDIAEDVTNNGAKNDFNCELLNEKYIDNSNPNLLENINTNGENGFEDMNMKFLNNELKFCEIGLKNNEMENISKDVTNNGENEKNINNSNRNLLENFNTNENGFEDMNMKFPNNELFPNHNYLSQDKNVFQLKKRQEFLPKGMSQIYKTKITRKYDIHDKSDYYENVIYNKFADDILINTEIFSPKPKNVDKFDKNYHRHDSNIKFDASSLRDAKVFGQIDDKFIATEVNDFLVIFDQHAVDERIKLESNLSDYFDGHAWSGTALDSIQLKMDTDDLLYLHNYKKKFDQFGLKWTFSDDNIIINYIPKAILGKHQRQEDVVLKAVKNLILEEIDVIKSIGNVNLYPKAIMDLVFSEACRNAIKFGDKLTKNKCVEMLKVLSTCKTPFQCAHGRPVMAVLIQLDRHIRNYEVNFQNIKGFKFG